MPEQITETGATYSRAVNVLKYPYFNCLKKDKSLYIVIDGLSLICSFPDKQIISLFPKINFYNILLVHGVVGFWLKKITMGENNTP